MKKSLLNLSAFVLALVAAGSTQAMPLSDLLAGGSITAGDKRFDQWTLIFQDSSEPGRTVNTANIDVAPLVDGGQDPGPGLQFDILSDEFMVTGDDVYAYLDFQFGFRVSVLDPNEQIKDNSLELTDWLLEWTDDGNNDLGVYIQETVGTAPGLNDLAIKEVTANVLNAVETDDLFDSAAFPPQSQIFVTKNILVWSQDLTDSARLTQFTQRFSQTTTTVPEPATVLLFGLGLAGLGFARRRKG